MSKVPVAFFLVAAGWLASAATYASASCDPAFMDSVHECARIVDSLRFDKAAQFRVFATNGAEFTAAQAKWMQAQLKLLDAACARGDRVEAARRLAEVRQLIKAHTRAS